MRKLLASCPFLLSCLYPRVRLVLIIAPSHLLLMHARSCSVLPSLAVAGPLVGCGSLGSGKSWQISETGLPHNGEAQLAEVRRADGRTAVLFSGRSNKGSHDHTPRGIAWSYDGGATFTDVRFAGACVC